LEVLSLVAVASSAALLFLLGFVLVDGSYIIGEPSLPILIIEIITVVSFIAYSLYCLIKLVQKAAQGKGGVL